MLPKIYRLPGHRIPEVLHKGKRTRGTIADCIVFKPTIEDLERSRRETKLTAIVPSKLSKKAVKRNRTKRLLVEAIHMHIKDIKRGYECIVMANKLFIEEKFQDIQPQVNELLVNARLLENKK